MKRYQWLSAVLLLGATPLAPESNAELQRQVRETERAFAKTMADRNHAAFTSFLSSEAVFLSSKTALRGRKQVSEGWKSEFEGPQAPFSWEPERVEVIDSGALAVSTGPVFGPKGDRIGTFTSTWRREEGGWKIVLDSGCPPCHCGEERKGK
jgi:ketosteroid isomerase-like protein